ncbi:MAG TPA: DUF1573 domain-containing protein [Pirellulales bacterium]|nr:DUF1573 domain-containing protein [Pirellulales bacterium]
MKTPWTMAVVVALGALLTTTISLAHSGTLWNWGSLSVDLPAEGPYEPESGRSASAAAAHGDEPPPTDGHPLVVADELEFDFGVEKNQTNDHRHVFHVRNAGEAPLHFVGTEVSCTKCTFVDLGTEDLAPGESGEIVVRWNIDTHEDHFRQSASVQTNDPAHPLLRFVITGKVVRPLELVPRELVLSKVQGGEREEVKARLFAFFDDDLRVTGHQFSDAATAKYFDVELTPLAKEDLPLGAKSGIELTVKLEPGLPLGSIDQNLQLTTNLEDAPKANLPIRGQVTGAISMIGRGWNKDYNLFEIGMVKRSAGKRAKLTLLVRGPHREGLKLEKPEQPDPDVLKITYGEPSSVKEGSATLVPVTFEIPPGSRLVSHMGGDTGRFAEVTIPTNKPELGRVKFSVKFAVVED